MQIQFRALLWTVLRKKVQVSEQYYLTICNNKFLQMSHNVGNWFPVKPQAYRKISQHINAVIDLLS